MNQIKGCMLVRCLLSLLLITNMNAMYAQKDKPLEQPLDARERSLVLISAMTATGNADQLKIQLAAGLDSGLTINQIRESLVQLYAYCGFPRSLNAINTFRMLLDERKQNGLADKTASDPVITPVADKYEQGRKVLETLTRTAQAKPAPGFGEFAPRIDAFLKEHLFADVFASKVLDFRQREIVTIAALASMEGVAPQLQSHIAMGKNTGVTDVQLTEIAVLISDNVGAAQSNVMRLLLGQPPVPATRPDLMVRIAELEIEPASLEEYKAILQVEAAASVKLEPGVLAIFPMYQREHPNQVRLIEIYASKADYQYHLTTPHFQHYKTATLKMVKSLALIDMEALDRESMVAVFEKIR